MGATLAPKPRFYGRMVGPHVWTSCLGVMFGPHGWQFGLGPTLWPSQWRAEAGTIGFCPIGACAVAIS